MQLQCKDSLNRSARCYLVLRDFLGSIPVYKQLILMRWMDVLLEEEKTTMLDLYKLLHMYRQIVDI